MPQATPRPRPQIVPEPDPETDLVRAEFRAQLRRVREKNRGPKRSTLLDRLKTRMTDSEKFLRYVEAVETRRFDGGEIIKLDPSRNGNGVAP